MNRPGRISLRYKMLAFTVGIVAALIALSLVVVNRYVAGNVHRQLSDDLRRTQSVFEAVISDRAKWLRSQCEVVAEDPRFVATLDIPSPNADLYRRTVLREARKFQSVIGSDMFLATDSGGRVLVRLDVLSASEVDLSATATVSSALEGRPYSGAWEFEGREFQVATVPISEGDGVLGTLSFGFTESMDVGWFVKALAGVSATDEIRDPILADDRIRVAELTREILIQSDCDLVAITDSRGRSLSVSTRAISFGEDLSSEEEIRVPLKGDIWSGLRMEQGRIVQMVTVPVWSPDEIVGVLGTGFAVDDQLARHLREMMRGEVSFAAEGSLIASTWPEAEREELAAKLFNPSGLYADQTRPFEISVGGETYLALMGQLKDDRGDVQGFYLIQFSLDKAVAFLHTLEGVLFTVGLIVLLASAAISFVGVTRITRPIRALVGGARRIGSGDLDHRIGVVTRDEVGELAVAFNEMTEALGSSHGALEASERLYRDLFDNAQDVVFTADMDHRFVTVNRAACAFWGYPEPELVGRGLFESIAPEDAEKLRETERDPKGGPPWPAVEVEAVRKDGKRAALEITSRWIVERDTASGIHAIGRDVTQRREREQATIRFRDQLYQAEKLRALGELAAGVAHNFNNLLTGVMGYAELMKLRTDIPEPVQQNAAKIVEAARRCSAIVGRIQAFGRPIDPTQTERVDLNRVVHDTVDITSAKWRTQAEREGRKIEMNLDLGEIPEVQSTGSAWEEVLTNLIFNAADAMPRGGRIRITTLCEEDTVLVQVSDSGTGMDEETQRRVFEPFFTTKETDRGTGLGLSTVWGLVQAQGGRVEIESELGKGTTFTIRVPESLPSDPGDSAQAPSEPVFGMEILVIDDEPSVRDFLPSLLVGHRVDTAESGPEGVRLFERKRHDLVITDWAMAGMSGLAVADRVKRLSPKTVVVLMTGWEIKGTAASQSPSVDLVFPKPFDAPKLDAALRQVALIQRGNSSGSGNG